MGLEFFSMLKTLKDVTAEYSSFEELKRMRQAYIVHVLDVILSERSRVLANDRAIKDEEEAQKGQHVGLDNVFELAKADNGDQSDAESDSEQDQHELVQQKETLEDTDLVSAANAQTATHDRRDQSLVRPKVLILAPFKQMAFQIIE